MGRDRQEDAVDRLRLLVDLVGADMLLRLWRLQRREAEIEIDALGWPGVTLDLHADRGRRHVEERAADADRQPVRRAGVFRAPGRPQQIGDDRNRADAERACE